MRRDALTTNSIVVERMFPVPPEKVWRALTEPHLIEAWLMANAFAPVPGHRFDIQADWGEVQCAVQVVEPNRTLSYSWDCRDLRSVVTWTLTATETGTLLRMNQTGFKPDQPRFYHGARAGWPRYLAAFEAVLTEMT